MPKIDEHIAQRIKDSANIMDVMSDLGVQLHKSGTEYVGLCPFHNGTKFGNFKVNPRKNIATCFGDCCRTWNPIEAVMEGMNMTYPEALRHLAATYNIYIDDEPKPLPMVGTSAPSDGLCTSLEGRPLPLTCM